jgi:hypothetical protein
MPRSVPRLRALSRTLALAALVVTGVVGPAPAGRDVRVTTGPAERLPARPLEVEPADGTVDGELGFDRQVTWLDLGDGQAAQPEIVLVNGSDVPLSLALEVRPVAADAAGAPVPVPDVDGEGTTADVETQELDPLPSAVDGITLAEDTVHLDPSEQARLRPAVGIPDGASSGAHLAALQATGTGPGPPIAVATFLVVNVGEEGTMAVPDVAVDVVQRGRSASVAVILRSGAGVDAADGRVDIRGWWGATEVRAELPPTLILPRTRRVVTLEASTPWLPGHHTVEVSVTSRSGDTVVASTSAWLWRPEAALVTLALLALIIGLAARRALSIRGSRTGIGGPGP